MPTTPDSPHVQQQNHIHQQCVDDGWNGHFSTVEDEWGGGNSNGLGGVLHAHFNYNGTADTVTKPAYAGKE